MPARVYVYFWYPYQLLTGNSQRYREIANRIIASIGALLKPANRLSAEPCFGSKLLLREASLST